MAATAQDNILEVLHFIRDNMAMRDEAFSHEDGEKLTRKVLEMDARMDTFATKDDLAVTQSEIIAVIDGFAKKKQVRRRIGCRFS